MAIPAYSLWMRSGIGFALLAAVLFGASTPLAKLLVGEVSPIMLAGLLYAGSGIGLSVLMAARQMMATATERIAWPSRRDTVWLGGAIVFGGVLGPVFLMLGLTEASASSASLLLNLEGVLTALLAWFLFRENFDARIATGMFSIALGGAVLAWDPSANGGVTPGALLVATACLCWAIDNNLTRKVSGSDAIAIAGLKGLIAGTTNLSIAFALGHALPANPVLAAAGLVGFFGYGLSLVLFVLALRHLGTARTGAYFSIAPFAGAALAVFLQHDAVGVQFIFAGALMAGGVWLHVTERHRHRHAHEPLAHEHAHTHDVHHRHDHDAKWDGKEPHVHPHIHAPIEHSHAHFPDLHHRHHH
jgi:drug/metabolite transporter (DMT)-like permease